MLVVDIETRGLIPELGQTAFAAATSTPDLKKVTVFRLDSPTDVELFLSQLRQADGIIGHNIVFDLRQIIVSLGQPHDFFDRVPMIWDTLLLAKHLMPNRGRYGLKELTAGLNDKLKHNDPKKWLKENAPKGQKNDFSLLPDEILTPYLVNDIIRTATLFQQLHPKVAGHRAKPQIELDHSLIKPVLRMQLRGCPMSEENLLNTEAANEALLAQAKAQIPFDFLKRGSIIAQFGDALRTMGFTTETGQPRADKESLKVLADRRVPYAEAMLRARGTHKLLSTYLRPWKRYTGGGRIHGSFSIFGARSGRFSSSSPNLQNIPKDLRTIIVPEPGHVFLIADYSQQELRAVAYLSKDPAMLKALEGDVHTETAKSLFHVDSPTPEQRKVAKTLVFACMYGARAKKIRSSITSAIGEKWSMPRCQEMLDKFWGKYSGVAAFGSQCMKFGERGIPLTDPTGRTQYPDPRRPYALLNFMIQGLCSDVTKKAMVRCAAAKLDMRLVVHDEIVIMTPRELVREQAVTLKDCMEHASPPFLFPVELSVGVSSWGGKISLTDYMEGAA